jgi:hypothetical protein
MKQQENYFPVAFLEASNIFEAVRAVAKIGSSLKPNHHEQVKLVLIPSALCSVSIWDLDKFNFVMMV